MAAKQHGGKRYLVNELIKQTNLPRPLAIKAVNAVIAAWTRALANHQPVQTPVGTIQIVPAPQERRIYGPKNPYKPDTYGILRLYTQDWLLKLRKKKTL